MSVDIKKGSQTLDNFVDLLLFRAIHSANQPAYTFLENGEDVSESLTYQEFSKRVLAVAAILQQRVPRGERVLLLYPACVDYMVGFFACLCAGIIAVPLFPPRGHKRSDRLEAVARDCQASAALTTSGQLAQMQQALAASPDLAALDFICSDTVAGGEEMAWRHYEVDGDTLAFLQYTSGSTGLPKGVMVSHRNLIENEKMIRYGIGSDIDSNFVSWLPIYHDMGIVGNMLHTFWLGSQCVFMAPAAFLQRPVRWLQAITRYRARVSGGPNFAYDLCVDKTTEAQRQELDLSSWKIAFNGAEPVRQATLERFADAFSASGFLRTSLYPCFGMAETTLMVSGNTPGAIPTYKWISKAELTRGAIVDDRSDNGQPLVGCGQILPGQIVRIVDPLTKLRTVSGQVGEIWISGGNVSRGYWNRDELNVETFNASVIGSDEGPFFRTGDLGFIDGGQLYISGRIKDVIIIRGANHYPQDIEAAAEAADPAIAPAGVAAFGVANGNTERVAVVAEIARTSLRKMDPKSIKAKIRQLVLEQREVVVDDIVLIRPGSLPKSSSGKVQRGYCRTLYLANELDRADVKAETNKMSENS